MTTVKDGTVQPPGEIPTAKARTQSMAEATIPVPAPMAIHIGTLNKQQSEIMEVICTIHDNINQKRADLMVCIPELRRVMCGLMEEHLVGTRLLATELSMDHNLLAHILHHDKLEDAANDALSHINHTVMDSEEDWTVYRDVCTGLHAPQTNDTGPRGV